tara:strand:- start:367 stop:792 length:426 start_codon:yes stop_codon:yes gene_type:complete
MNKQFTVLFIALGEYGTLEDLSSGSNPQVLKYYAKTGNSWVKDDGVAWCAAFVGYCLEMALIASTKLLNARSYLKWGKATLEPKLGDIVVFWRISPTSPYGHVAFFIKKDKNYVWVLGGNQSDSVKIEKYPITQVLSYRTY